MKKNTSFRSLIQSKLINKRFSSNSEYYMGLEDKYGCHNYKPIPVVIEKGKGCVVTDVDGKSYLDFLAAYSAVNQGHCHPKIQETFVKECQNLTLISRAFYNKNLGIFQEYLNKLFGFDKALIMNTGCEGTESAIKFARRWAYNVKGVPDNEARVLFAYGNFWGRSIAACGSSEDISRYHRFGPYGLNFDLVEFDDIQVLDKQLSTSKNYAAYCVEPIQGERGVIIPSSEYMQKAKQICKKHNVLLIADEIQTGLGRTGKLLALDHDNVRPDMLVLGKALSGGFMPVSAVLADNEVMDQIKPGEHGSTYGGNPLGCATSVTALQVLIDEKMTENSERLGRVFLEGLNKMKRKYIKDIRGRGLFIAVEFESDNSHYSAYDLCMILKDNGLLAKPTHNSTIRFSPPLVITETQIKQTLEIVNKSLDQLEKKGSN